MDDAASHDTATTQQQQSKTQILLDEEYDVQQLQERERSIRQLEVS